MLDIKFIVENPELVKNACKVKNEPDYVDEIIELQEKRCALVAKRDSMRSKLNDFSKEISLLAQQKEDLTEIKAQAKEISDKVKVLENKLKGIEEKKDSLLLKVPNIPHKTVPEGTSDKDNVIIRQWGVQKQFDFKVKDHLQLNEILKLFDPPTGAKLTGSFFPLYTDRGARLVRALINLMLDHHTHDGKYIEILPPIIANTDSLIGSAQLPKLEDDMYKLNREEYFLIPTGEVPLINMHRNELLKESDLPIHYCAYTPCFRREAGSYGKDTKGLIRLHQFNKVELVKFVHPDDSWKALEELLEDIEKILQLLGLFYRINLLCTADLTFASAKTYDIEVWAPGTGKWLEVSSVSNTTDFQARRMNTRFRPKNGGKPQYIHTLNGSGTAIPRIIIAILENYQNNDGSITIPETLAKYYGDKLIEIQ